MPSSSTDYKQPPAAYAIGATQATLFFSCAMFMLLQPNALWASSPSVTRKASRALSCATPSSSCPCKMPKLGLGLSNDLLIDASEAVKLKLHERCDIKFVDGSYLSRLSTGNERDFHAEFEARRIPGSAMYNFDELKDVEAGTVNKILSPEQFESFVSAMGISAEDHVVIYQRNGSIGAARAWWSFRLFGHNKVSYLNGGLDAWARAGGQMESGPKVAPKSPDPNKMKFKAVFNKSMLASLKDVETIMATGAMQILDARSGVRFRTEEGHIPGSLNLPYVQVVHADDHSTFRSPEEIRDAFFNSGLVFGSRAVLSCGSGITACILALGLQIIGKDITKAALIYNGSWNEWSANPKRPTSKF